MRRAGLLGILIIAAGCSGNALGPVHGEKPVHGKIERPDSWTVTAQEDVDPSPDVARYIEEKTWACDVDAATFRRLHFGDLYACPGGWIPWRLYLNRRGA